MDDKNELTLRRKAIRLFLKGLKPRIILQKINKSRAWFYKWKKRFELLSWSGLKSRSKRPHHSPQSYSRSTRARVIRLRCALEKRSVGLVGAKAIQQELRQQRLLRAMPALATINLWLKAEGLTPATAPVPRTIYYPEPTGAADWVLHGMDWTARYIQGGEKVFVFHTVDAETRALHQTIRTDKRAASWRQHALQSWQTLGLPHAVQLDNDSAVTGGEKAARHFSVFVRLCLYMGIALIFTPPGEPKRNWLVETLNGLWVKSFWNRQHFHSLTQVLCGGHQFTDWYMNQYYPPALKGLTPAQAHRRVQRVHLTKQQIRQLPEELPITAGRLHFIRRVSAEGTISFLGETGKVGKRWAGQYVWATVITHRRQLDIYHQRSEHAAVRLIQTFYYEIPETVCRLRPEFRR